VSVNDRANASSPVKLPRHGSWLAKSLWLIFGSPFLTILFLALVGGLFGYLAAIRGDTAPTRHVLVGVILGGFLGIEFALSRTVRSKAMRTAVAALVGAVAGGSIGMVLSRSPVELLLFSLCLAIAGAWGPSLLRHVNFP
jgi:uncharacterized membrane protein (UPF0136 family)